MAAGWAVGVLSAGWALTVEWWVERRPAVLGRVAPLREQPAALRELPGTQGPAERRVWDASRPLG